MAQGFKFSVEQAQTVAKLINNICIAGSQTMQMDQPNIWHKACSNLRDLQKKNPKLFKMLDQMAASLNEEHMSSVIEGLEIRSNDAAGMLSLTRRCLNSSAFLAHCLAVGEIRTEASRIGQQPLDPQSVH